MTTNPLLLAKLFLKHQPAAKTFEEAVAMEVDGLKKEWAQIDDELNALAVKGRDLAARKHELIEMRRELLGCESAEQPDAVAQPERTLFSKMPVAVEKEPPQAAPHQISSPRVRNLGVRMSRLRAGASVQEYVWRDRQYMTVARSLGIGTHESAPLRGVWLTESEVTSVRSKINAGATNRGSVGRAYYGRRNMGKKGWREGRKYLSAHYVSLAHELGVGRFCPDGSVVFETIDDYQKVRNVALQREEMAAARQNPGRSISARA